MRRIAFVIALSVLALIIGLNGQQAAHRAHASFPGHNGKIAFATFSPVQGATGIWTVEADGSGERPLITGAETNQNPAWSADGTKIAFTRQGPGSSSAEIWIADADGSHQSPVVAAGTGLAAPTWSPDGKEIAFMSEGGIAAVNITTGARRQITTKAGDFADLYPKWSPDGTRIVFYGGRGSSTQNTDATIWVVNADGTGLHQLTGGHDALDVGPSWSPNGDEIAYVSDMGSCIGICVISAAGGSPRQVASSNTIGPVVSWSPDGQEITFVQGVGDPIQLELFVANAGGGGVRQLTTSDMNHLTPDWQPLPCPSLLDIPEDLQTVDDLDGDGIPNDVEEQETQTDPECPDTDVDGLLDPWEVPESVTGSGFDIDQDGTPDVGRDVVFGPYNGECGTEFGPRREQKGQNCSLVFPPDPLHKDVYVEIDWQDCLLGSCPELVGLALDPSHHAPNMDGLLDVVNLFRDAPVKNPADANGITLNILVDEAIPHDHNCDQGEAETRPTNFGTPEQRADPEVMAAKEMAYRYAWSGHSSLHATPQECPLPAFWEVLAAGMGVHPLPEYDISPAGYATTGGRDILVTLAVSWICQLYTFDSGPIVDYAPCFRSLAPTIGIAPGLFPAEISLPGGGTIDVQWPMHMMLGVAPSQGVRQLWGRTFMNLLGQSLGLSAFDAANDPNQVSPHGPESYRTWVDLQYAPPAPGSGSSFAATPEAGAGFEPILPNFALAQEDADGDGTPEGEDNCPGVANAGQADLDGDGLGDACDADEDGDGLTGDADSSPGDTDNDGIPNVEDSDADGDGVANAQDNCPLAANAGQGNADGDAAGDACDPDADGDGLPNALEAEVGSDPLAAGSSQEFLGDGDSCADGLDNDGDGETDGADSGCLDPDGDTVPNLLDNCPEVKSENVLDSDGDGRGNVCDAPNLSGDVDCSGAVNAVDALKLSRHLAGLGVSQSESCPDIGTGNAAIFGDVNCDGSITAVDTLFVLRFVAGLPVDLPQGCRPVGT